MRTLGGGHPSVGAAHLSIATVLIAMGRDDEALTELQRALAIEEDSPGESGLDLAATHSRIGAPTWLARTRLEWGRMLLARQEAEDEERATALFQEALKTARELGLGNLERRTAKLLQDLT